MTKNLITYLYLFFSLLKLKNNFIFNILLFIIFYSFLVSNEYVIFSSDILIFLNAFLVFSTLIQFIKKDLVEFVEIKKKNFSSQYFFFFFNLKKIFLDLFYLNNLYFIISIILFEILLYINIIIIKNLNILNIFLYSKFILNNIINHFFISNIKLEIKIKKELYKTLVNKKLEKIEEILADLNIKQNDI